MTAVLLHQPPAEIVRQPPFRFPRQAGALRAGWVACLSVLRTQRHQPCSKELPPALAWVISLYLVMASGRAVIRHRDLLRERALFARSRGQQPPTAACCQAHDNRNDGQETVKTQLSNRHRQLASTHRPQQPQIVPADARRLSMGRATTRRQHGAVSAFAGPQGLVTGSGSRRGNGGRRRLRA